MNDTIHVGFESDGLSFVSDMTVNELVTIITETVDSFEEVLRATDLLGGVWTSGAYEGTGWRFWFSRRIGNAGASVH